MLINDIQSFESNSSQEMAIKSFLLKDLNVVLEASVLDVSMMSYTSKSSVVRFCKKLGFTGYRDFKIQLIKELHSIEKEKLSLTKDTLLEIDSIKKKLTFTNIFYQTVIEETEYLLSNETLNRIINKIKRINKIEFYGMGSVYFKTQEICLRLQMLGYQAFAYTSYNTDIDNMGRESDKSDTLAFFISYSGQNETIIKNADHLREKGAFVVGITSNSQGEGINKACNELIKLFVNKYCAELYTASLDVSLQYILDIIYINCLTTKLKMEELKNN